MERFRHHTKKVFIGIVGALVVITGLILVPYPGPGWLIVFAGLALLSTEFEFAARWLNFARGKYDAWAAWLKRQNPVVRGAVLAGTGLVIVATMWLLNVPALVGGFIGIHWAWLQSPLPFLH